MRLPGEYVRSSRAWALGLAIAGVGFCTSASAQDEAARIRELERKLERSLQLIDQLTNRVNELERGPPRPSAPAKPLPAPAQEARIEALEKNVTQMASARGERDDFGVPLHGFTDVGYQHSTLARDDGGKSGFFLGNLDLFITPNFGRVKMLAELNFEVAEDGSLATDLERLQLGYTFSDSLTGWVGRFHTPYGYWNNAFHHGAQIQTSVTRPRFIDFEDAGGILPAHSVGLWATGRVPMGDGKLVYDAYVANGNKIQDNVLDFQAFSDDDSNKEFGFNLGYRFGGALNGLLVGLHGLEEHVASYDAVGSVEARTKVSMTGGYFYYDGHDWEVVGEYYRFRNKDLMGGTGTHSSWASFVQLGYTFNELWTPFLRWEKTSLDQSDPYFATQASGRTYSRNVLGLRYSLNANTALKIEGNRTREFLGEEKSYTEARAQFAVRF